MKIMLLCQSLVVGGTQRQIAVLAPALKRRGHDVSVTVFYDGGPFVSPLTESGITVYDLEKRGRWDIASFFVRFRNLVVHERPDVLYAFLPVGNIVAALAKLSVRRPPRIVFGVRSSRMMLESYDWLTRQQYWIEALFWMVADRVIVNSRNSLDDRVARGFHANRICVVPNGIDTGKFRPNAAARAQHRAEWGIRENETLVGQVARFDPMKGHEVFFAAAAKLLRQDAPWRFVCIGVGGDKSAQALAMADQYGIRQRVIFAGERTDTAACFPALDIACQASRFGEGFPNALAEAMACGVPCVATDVGDSRAIIGNLGVVVQPGDAVALAAGLEDMRKRIVSGGFSAAVLRRSIVDQFSVEALAERTELELRKIDSLR
ncbi:MAG: glycosyltransferase [Rhizomicrobium sp.]